VTSDILVAVLLDRFQGEEQPPTEPVQSGRAEVAQALM
jgi:hypothetical protein